MDRSWKIPLQQARKLGAFAFFFVFEINEHLAAGLSIGGNPIRPALNVVGRIAFVAQPEIRVSGSDIQRRGHSLAVCDSQSQIAFPQPLERLFVEPRGVSELECGADARRERLQEGIEYGQILLRARWQLKQQGAELVAECARDI